jgi:hypothetical protein
MERAAIEKDVTDEALMSDLASGRVSGPRIAEVF